MELEQTQFLAVRKQWSQTHSCKVPHSANNHSDLEHSFSGFPDKDLIGQHWDLGLERSYLGTQLSNTLLPDLRNRETNMGVVSGCYICSDSL